MLVGKDVENVLNSQLTVDKWRGEYEDDNEEGKDILEDIYEGQVAIEKTEEHMYLGFVLSSVGNSMANINSMKKKSKGIIRKIFNRINGLNLRKYYFQSAMVLMNAMLRSSILLQFEGRGN